MHETRAERRRRAREETRHARHRKPVLNMDGTYGVQPGWFATLDDVEDAKKQSHDMLIASMGDRRIGPVQWRWFDGDDAHHVLDDLQAGETGEYELSIYRRIRAHLREYGGYVIVALAEGRRS